MKALLIAAACAFASPVFGQWVWNGSESGEWNDSANWTPAGVPGSWNSVLFDSAGGGHTWIDLPTSPVTVKNITFDSASCDAYTIGKPGEELHLNWSGAVTLNAGVTQNQTIAADFIQMNCDGGQNASYNLVNNSVASLNTAAHIAPGPGGVTYTLFLKGSGSGINNLSGLISDGTTLIELGLWVEGGIWALTGSNTFGGGVTIEGGTLVANTIVNGSQSSSLGNSDNTDTNLAFTSPSGSSTLRYVGADTSTNRNFWINDGSTAIFDIAGGNLTFTGGANNINNTGSLVKSGSAMLAFNSNNYYSGATTISGGVLSVMTVANGGQASGIGKSSSDASNLVFDGGTLQYANTSVLGLTNRNFTITDGKMAVFETAYSTGMTMSGSVGPTTGGISLIGGSLLLSGYNQYTGPTIVSGYRSTLIAGSNSGAFGGALGVNSDVTLSAGATLSTENISTLMIGSLTGDATTQAYFSDPNLTFAINSPRDATFQGVITSFGGVTKLGSGIQTLTGSNFYQGATIIQGGGITLSGANGTIAYSNSIAISGNASLVVGNLAAGTHTDRISDTAPVTMSGGTLSFLTESSAPSTSETIGAMAVTGGYNTISNGMAGYGKTSTLTIASLTRTGGAVVNFSGESLGFNNQNRILFTSAPTLGDWALWNGVGYAAYDPVLGIVEAEYADVTLGSSGSKVIYSASEGNIRVIDGTGTPGPITLGNATTAVRTLTQSASGGSVTIDTSGKTFEVQSVLVGTGASALTIGTAPNSGNLTATYTGVTLVNNSSNSLIVNSTVADAELPGGPFSISLTTSGLGNITLAGTNTYTGVTTISQGILNISTLGNGGVAGNLGAASNAASNIVFEGGTLRYTGNATATDRGFTVTSDGSRIETESDVHFSGAGINLAGGPLEIGGAGNTTITSIMSGSGGLVKTDASTLTLEGANTFTGGVTIRGGSVSVESMGYGGMAGNLGASSDDSSNLVLDGGSLFLTGSSTTSTNRGLSVTAAGGAIVSANAGADIYFQPDENNAVVIARNGTFTVDGPGATTFFNQVTGAGSLRKSGDGVASLQSGANTFSGSVTISGGTLATTTVSNGGVASGIGAATADPANLVFDGGILSLTPLNTTQTTDRGFSITAGKTATFMVANNSSLRFSGSVPATTGGLTMAGNGVLILSGNMAFAGAARVNAGTLIIDGTLGPGTYPSDSVYAAAGAILGGSGTIRRDVYIGGTHSPGSSPGIQTIEGAVIYEAGATVEWELVASTTDGRGTNYDGINGDGHIAHFLGATTMNLVFNLPGSTVKWSDGLWGANRQWIVYSGFVPLGFENFTLAPTNWADSTGVLFSDALPGSTFTLTQSGQDIILNYTGVPEPSTWALLALGALALLCRRAFLPAPQIPAPARRSSF